MGIRILVELEDIINETWEDRDGRKKMSKNNSKSLGALRQRLRKYMKDFEEDVKKFQENPDAADDEDEKDKTKDGDDMDSGDDSGDDDDAIPDASAFKKSKSKSTTPGDDDDESDDSYWDSDSDESSSSSGDDQPGISLREKFLKKSGGGKGGDGEEGADRETRKKL